MKHFGRLVVLLTCAGWLVAQPPPPPSDQPPPAQPERPAPLTQAPKPGGPTAVAPNGGTLAPVPTSSGQLQSTTVQSAPSVAAPPATPNAAAPAPAAPPASSGTGLNSTDSAPSYSGLSLQNASLTEVIDLLARQLKLNYVLDPGVRGSITLNTYGELKDVSPKELLDTILRITGHGMVKTGQIWRIVPVNKLARLPIAPSVDQKSLLENDAPVLNLIFLKYVGVEDMLNLLKGFIGEGAEVYSYAPANLLILLDSSRSMRRTMELISLFDNDEFANRRVKLYEVKNGKPADIAKELESIFKAISLNDKSTPIKFLPLDRINTIIAVVPNSAAFDQIQTYIDKLDVAPKITAGSIDNYLYRVRYGRAELLAASLSNLYGINTGQGGQGFNYFGNGLPGSGATPGYGNGGGGAGYGNSGAYGNGGGGGFGGSGGGFGGGGGGFGGGGGGFGGGGGGGFGGSGGISPVGGNGQGQGGNQTGQYLAGTPQGPNSGNIGGPRIVPNLFDNSILIQATPQDYAAILKLLKEIDVAPRQVLIEAKIYEVSLTGSLSFGVQAYLNKLNQSNSFTAAPSIARSVASSFSSGGLILTGGALVGHSRELLAVVQAAEVESHAKVISAPNVIATDSIPANIIVGSEVPTATGSLTSGFGNGASVATSIQNRNTGVTLSIMARVNPSGIVTMVINQEVSSPIAPTPGSGLNTPSFSKRAIQTQVTSQDGDTIAIGGVITDNNASSNSGVPYLDRLPWIGALFGGKSQVRERTELVIFLTPRVIYDTNEMIDATEELKGRLKRVSRIIRE